MRDSGRARWTPRWWLSLFGWAWLAALGFVYLMLVPPSWGTLCAYRHCERALGVSWDRPPYPVAEPSCDDLRMCANEMPDAAAHAAALRALLAERSCEQP